jgi:dTDP-4-dehydrorhamnose 3,5-epimerase
VPQGFAHGYCTLESDTEVAYKVDNHYSQQCDRGVLWNDPTLGIAWPTTAGDAIVSERDAGLPLFAEFKSPF